MDPEGNGKPLLLPYINKSDKKMYNINKLKKEIVENADPERLAQLKKCQACDFFLTCWFLPGSKTCRGILKNYGGKQ